MDAPRLKKKNSISLLENPLYLKREGWTMREWIRD
jgi:hypothetical protein